MGCRGAIFSLQDRNIANGTPFTFLSLPSYFLLTFLSVTSPANLRRCFQDPRSLRNFHLHFTRAAEGCRHQRARQERQAHRLPGTQFSPLSQPLYLPFFPVILLKDWKFSCLCCVGFLGSTFRKCTLLPPSFLHFRI